MLKVSVPLFVAASFALLPSMAAGEILAMVNYETKSPESLKALKSPVAAPARKEGIAIIDVDPESKTFGKIVQDIALPGDLVAHHIFYNHDQSKAHLTALGKEELRVIDMKKTPYKIGKVVAVPGCSVGEDVVFSDDGKYWYLTCMGSQAMVVGDAKKDQPIKTIKVAAPYPHGIAIHNGIDRILLSMHDFSAQSAGIALEIYFNKKADRMYVTTAKPGHLHIFDLGAGPGKPKLLKSVATAEGAHHVAFTLDGRYAYVQNALLNLPGMSDGSITVIDLKSDKVIGSVDTLKNVGYNPNSMVLLPRWNDPAGH